MNPTALVAIVFAPMTSLQSYVCGQWTAGSGDPVALHDPSTEAIIGDVRPGGVDFAATLAHARTVGGPALRALTFQQRGQILKGLSKVIHEHRDELIEIAGRSRITHTSARNCPKRRGSPMVQARNSAARRASGRST